MTAVTVTLKTRSLISLFLLCCSDGDAPGARAAAAAVDLPRKTVLHGLRRTCAGGHLPLAQWLAAHYGVTAEEGRMEECYVFRVPCAKGHSDTATWAAREFETTPDEARRVGQWVFRWARRVGALDAALAFYRDEFGLQGPELASAPWGAPPAESGVPSAQELARDSA